MFDASLSALFVQALCLQFLPTLATRLLIQWMIALAMTSNNNTLCTVSTKQPNVIVNIYEDLNVEKDFIFLGWLI